MIPDHIESGRDSVVETDTAAAREDRIAQRRTITRTSSPPLAPDRNRAVRRFFRSVTSTRQIGRR